MRCIGHAVEVRDLIGEAMPVDRVRIEEVGTNAEAEVLELDLDVVAIIAIQKWGADLAETLEVDRAHQIAGYPRSAQRVRAAPESRVSEAGNVGHVAEADRV